MTTSAGSAGQAIPPDDRSTIADGRAKRIRFGIQYGGIDRLVATIGWSKRDSSLYVMPASSPQLVGYVGTAVVSSLAPLPFDAREQASASRSGAAPKVSIHESGQCHGEIGSKQTRLVRATALTSDRNFGHICTISAGDYGSLPELKPDARTSVGVARDYDPIFTAASLTLYAFTAEEQIVDTFPHGFALRRGDNRFPLWIAMWFRGIAHDGPSDPGVMVLAGWRRDRRPWQPLELVYGLTTSATPVVPRDWPTAIRREASKRRFARSQ